MDLPAKGENVPLSRIEEICEFYELNALWTKMERDPPERPFKSDGCSMFFGVRVGGHEVFKQSFSWGFGRS